MSRDKLGLFTFGLTLIGLITYIKTDNIAVFAIGIISVAALIFTKSKLVT
jgi:hypothetical protein